MLYIKKPKTHIQYHKITIYNIYVQAGVTKLNGFYSRVLMPIYKSRLNNVCALFKMDLNFV